MSECRLWTHNVGLAFGCWHHGWHVPGRILDKRSKPQPASCLDSSVSSCVNVERTFWVHFSVRRRYDPAALRLASSAVPSVLTARLQERREGSHPRAAVQFVAVAGIRISFQLLAEIPGIFFFQWLYLLLSLKVIPPACRAVSCGLRWTLTTRVLPKVCFDRRKTRFYHCDAYFFQSLAHIPPSDRLLQGDER